MQRISVYDEEAKKIAKLVDETDTSEAEVIQAIFDALNDHNIKVEDYL